MEEQKVRTLAGGHQNWLAAFKVGEAQVMEPRPNPADRDARKIGVVLADDHILVRAGIRSLLQEAPDIDVVGEAGDGVETLALVRAVRPDVLVLDLDMPRLDGIQVARQLCSEDSPVRILILSAYDDPQLILSLFEIGAAGYLIKEDAPESLLTALRALAKGERGWVSRSLAEKVVF